MFINNKEAGRYFMPQKMVPHPYTYKQHQLELNILSKMKEKIDKFGRGHGGRVEGDNGDRYGHISLCTRLRFSETKNSC